jgi:hypothetical protein
MAFKQYTECVDIQLFDPGNPLIGAALLGLYITLPPGTFAALLAVAKVGSPWCLLLLAEVYVIAGILGYAYWFLYRRLICLPSPPEHPADSAGDQLVIGTLINILTPEPIGDNDYSIGILPQGNPLGASASEVQASTPYGYLVTNQDVIKNYPLLYTGHPDFDTDPNTCPVGQIQSEVLHCEFEGRGMYDVYLTAHIALFIAIVAVFACFIPGAGWVTAILAILAFLIAVGGFALGTVDGGDPNDVNPNVGELHTNQCDHTGADALVVKGHWVYDSGHRFPLQLPLLGHQKPGAWNELHPITFCTKTTSDPGDVILFRKRWRKAIDDATSPATLASQAQPQNQWQVHPLLDGCQPPIVV